MNVPKVFADDMLEENPHLRILSLVKERWHLSLYHRFPSLESSNLYLIYF